MSQAQKAQAARRQAEQQARIGEMRRREQVSIKKGDTAEGLAARYGTTPQAIAQQTKGKMVAGQVLDLDVPDTRRQAGPITPAIAGVGITEKIVQEFSEFIGGLFGGREQIDPATGYAQLEQGLTDTLADVGEFHAEGDRLGGATEDAWQRGLYAREQTPEEIQQSIDPTADWAAITDRSRDIEMKEQLQGDYGALRDYQQELSLKVYSMRYTHQALGYAWTSGDMSLRPNYLTQFEWDNLSADQKMKVQDDLGYVYDPISEVYVPLDMPEEGYGMGGYDYGDYGGVGGAVDDYVPPRYTGSSLQIQVGGRVTRGGGRLTTGYVPASRWRI